MAPWKENSLFLKINFRAKMYFLTDNKLKDYYTNTYIIMRTTFKEKAVQFVLDNAIK